MASIETRLEDYKRKARQIASVLSIDDLISIELYGALRGPLPEDFRPRTEEMAFYFFFQHEIFLPELLQRWEEAIKSWGELEKWSHTTTEN